MRKLVLLSMLSVLFVACGKDGKEEAEEFIRQAEEQKFFNQSESGTCGEYVAIDYMSVRLKCNDLTTLENVKTCRNYWNKFLEKYPRINCEAEVGYGLVKEKIKLNYSSIKIEFDVLNEIVRLNK